MATRLKQLREERGLSHQKLSDTIDETLGVSISKDSLMKYEVATEHHSTPFKNLGMRVEYLTALATFYGVSTDYILGLTDIRSPSIDTQAIIEQTGLTEKNTLLLECLQSQGSNANLDYLNDLISVSMDGDMLIHYLLMKTTLSIPRPVAWSDIDFNNLSFDQMALLTGNMRQYGYIYFTGKDAFEYHCSRLAKEFENALLQKYAATAKWGYQDGID